MERRKHLQVDRLNQDKISLCVCTYKRPSLLAEALTSLINQERDPHFCFEVVVVDNDSRRSAEDVVCSFQQRTDLVVKYACEPVQNIALARNRAIQTAAGRLVAFIDDDEYASPDWLRRLYQTLSSSMVDGVLGPVLPEFPEGAPDWLRKGNFFDRRRLPTGTMISERDGRTGNVLFRREIVTGDGIWFDPARGRTGGEDTAFFRTQMGRGRKFVWCDEAVAYEIVPEERWRASFYLKKYLRIGTLTGELVRAGEVRPRILPLRSLILLAAYAAALPIALILGRHIWIAVLTKLSYCVGCVTGFVGITLLRERA